MWDKVQVTVVVLNRTGTIILLQPDQEQTISLFFVVITTPMRGLRGTYTIATTGSFEETSQVKVKCIFQMGGLGHTGVEGGTRKRIKVVGT